MKSVCLLKRVILTYGRVTGCIQGGVDLGWKTVEGGKMMCCNHKRYYHEVIAVITQACTCSNNYNIVQCIADSVVTKFTSTNLIQIMIDNY